MSETQQLIEQNEISIEAAEANIERLAALERLMENKDFQSVVLEGYLDKEPARCAGLRADMNFLTAAGTTVDGIAHQKEEINEMIVGVGRFQAYLSRIEIMGDQAGRAIEGHRATREQLLAEQLEAEAI